jgi:hypothetical protein
MQPDAIAPIAMGIAVANAKEDFRVEQTPLDE